MRDTADGDTAGPVGLDNRSDGNKGEGIGCAVADLAIDMLAADRGRQHGGGDELALFKNGIDAQAYRLAGGESRRSG